jgi:hypothetical protein
MAWSLFSQSQVSPLQWAQNVLQAGRWPISGANEQSFIAWALLEGGGGTYNPLNTTLPEPGAGCFNSVCVRNYVSWGQGVTATVATLNGGYYPQIVADLRSGRGIGATPELATWSGGGYDSLAGTWAEAAQYMHGKTGPLPGGKGGSAGGQAGATAVSNALVAMVEDYKRYNNDSLAGHARWHRNVATMVGEMVK